MPSITFPQIKIRDANQTDLPQILDIYNDVIEHTTAVFSYAGHTIEMRDGMVSFQTAGEIPGLCGRISKMKFWVLVRMGLSGPGRLISILWRIQSMLQRAIGAGAFQNY